MRSAWWNEMDGLLSAEATATRITALVWPVSFYRADPVPTRGRLRLAELQTRMSHQPSQCVRNQEASAWGQVNVSYGESAVVEGVRYQSGERLSITDSKMRYN
jgi:hypothetical protein